MYWKLHHSLGYSKVSISLLRHAGCIVLQSPKERKEAGARHGDRGHHPHVLQEHNQSQQEHKCQSWTHFLLL